MKKIKKNNYIILILIVLFCISVGYAVINRTLSITGNSEVVKNTWDIHFENVKVKEGSVTANTPVIDTTTKLTVNFNVMLNLPGDFYEFTVDVVNSGTIDAMVDSVVKTPTLTASQAKYLNYSIEYQNGEQISTKQLVKANEFVRIKVRVEYRDDLTENDLPTTTETLNLGFTVNYVQADSSTGVVVKDNGVFKITASGLLDEIGTIVTIGTEKFYTIGTEGDNVKLLSMHNLYVGNQSDGKNVVALTNPTGKQSETARGWFDGYSADNPIIGTTAFSSDSQKGTNYSDYNGSIVEGYVNNYKTILENDYDVDIVEARLITKEELTSEEIGCSAESNTCINAPSFIYSTTYWSGSAISTNVVWSVYIDGKLNIYAFGYDNNFGVRPVIVLKKSDIVIDFQPTSNGDINEIGTVVTIGTEKFYTIGTEGDNVKLLAKNNLYVGGIYDFGEEEFIPFGEEATGMQYDDSVNPYDYGTTPFATDEHHGIPYNVYNGSLVEVYVNNYKSKLEEKFKLTVNSARLILESELTDANTFACVFQDYCSDKYPWIYSTAYWTGTPINDTNIKVVINKQFMWESFGGSMDYGVRPVIVISKDYFN